MSSLTKGCAISLALWTHTKAHTTANVVTVDDLWPGAGGLALSGSALDSAVADSSPSLKLAYSVCCTTLWYEHVYVRFGNLCRMDQEMDCTRIGVYFPQMGVVLAPLLGPSS